MKYSIDENFKKTYNEWDKTDPTIYFTVGNTSNALQSIGIKKQPITLDSSKVIKIKNKHSENDR
ncbi:MAG: hypothetical protein LUG95_06010 [Clostridiales bacterium]|nr:hypothetical protein [Clostridiales bacterium]